MDIAGKTVTIVGGKRSGMALARLIVQLNGKAKLSDQDEKECLSQEFYDWASAQNIHFEFGGHTQEFITDADLIVLSPGVPFDAEPVQWAKAADIPIVGEIEFAAQFCNKPIIAVTGSNGKTTVSTLIDQLLVKAGYKVCLCGNVGHPFSEFVLNLDHIDFIVLEVSSFQMESVHSPDHSDHGSLTINGFKPYISVILNFSQNHLDRHKDLEEYFSAKKRVCINQNSNDHLVLNYEDPESQEIAAQATANIVYFNDPKSKESLTNPNFSTVKAVGKILGIDDQNCRAVFDEFKGVEHRLEKVRSIDGIDFINDSKATTAEAALWALESIDQPIVMICGGRDKNIDFSVLADSVQEKVKHMFVIGEARAKIGQAFKELIVLEECDGLQEAVTKARNNAAPGDCVLLSPMCASFDMFADFEERGRVFKEIVNNLT